MNISIVGLGYVARCRPLAWPIWDTASGALT